jgi:phosphogluconate dehydratase
MIRLDAVAGTLMRWSMRPRAARPQACITDAASETNAHGLGRELFGGMRRNVLSAEEGACTWLESQGIRHEHGTR